MSELNAGEVFERVESDAAAVLLPNRLVGGEHTRVVRLVQSTARHVVSRHVLRDVLATQRAALVGGGVELLDEAVEVPAEVGEEVGVHCGPVHVPVVARGPVAARVYRPFDRYFDAADCKGNKLRL